VAIESHNTSHLNPVGTRAKRSAILDLGSGNSLALDFPSKTIGKACAVNADCFQWLSQAPENSVHAMVTDPPYGVKEYNPEQIEKRSNGNGGIWRIPPSFDGNVRSPLPRFTALNSKERRDLSEFFFEWAKLAVRVIRPGGHVFVAANAFLSQSVFESISQGGFEYRGQIVRLVRTLRGGDRPKNAEDEFSDVATMFRSAHEPWGVFRKPIPTGMRVSDCLREYETGGLRRMPDGTPPVDVITSERTSKLERSIAPHPSLKPQNFLRLLAYLSLPMGEGVVLDPFMGSGSTLAAAEALGVESIGIERSGDYFKLACKAIPKLAMLNNGSLINLF